MLVKFPRVSFSDGMGLAAPIHCIGLFPTAKEELKESSTTGRLGVF